MKLLNPSGSHIPGSCSAGVSAAASLHGHPGGGCQHHWGGAGHRGHGRGFGGAPAEPGLCWLQQGQRLWAWHYLAVPVSPRDKQHPVPPAPCARSGSTLCNPGAAARGPAAAGLLCPGTFVTGGCPLLRVVPMPCWLHVPGGTRGRSTRPRRAGPPRVLQLRLLCMQACGWQLSAASCLCRAIRICRCLRCLTSSSRG